MADGTKQLIKIPVTCDPGDKSEFRKIRSGTDRAAILKMMNGTKSAEQIARAMGDKFTARYVMAHAYCLRRDCAIGYTVTEKGKLLAIYPGDLTFKDTVKKPQKTRRSASSQEESAAA